MYSFLFNAYITCALFLFLVPSSSLGIDLSNEFQYNLDKTKVQRNPLNSNQLMTNDVQNNDYNNKKIQKDGQNVQRSIVRSKMNLDEIKRAQRQTRKSIKQRPGFFWTLGRVIFETFNDTQSAISQIGQLINENIVEDTPPPPIVTTGSSLMITNVTPASVTGRTNENVTRTTTTTTKTTTTEKPFVLTRGLLQNIVRRNLKGLIRLLNIEWRDALNDSEYTVKEFRRNLGKQIGSFLQDDPDAF